MKTYFSVLLSAWTTGFVTFAISQVGTTPDVVEYTADLPIGVAVITLIPAVLGFLIGASK